METTLLSRIKAHSEPSRSRRLEVPEWGTPATYDADGKELEPPKPMVITYSMVTLDDLSQIQALDGDDLYKRATRAICLKARDEAGKPIFGLIDALQLREVAAPDVVMRVALSMFGRLSVDDALKN